MGLAITINRVDSSVKTKNIVDYRLSVVIVILGVTTIAHRVLNTGLKGYDLFIEKFFQFILVQVVAIELKVFWV